MVATVDAKKIKAADVIHGLKRGSRDWLNQNFYDQWVSAFKNYKCERDPEKDPETGEIDTERSAIAMPSTYSVVRRKEARVTAQIPNLRFRHNDKDLAQRISWKVMRDWDLGGVQRQQPRHIRQALIFGWSVRPWYWAIDERKRSKRVDPYNEDPTVQQSLLDEYGDSAPPEVMGDPEMFKLWVLGEHGKGRNPPLVRTTYKYKTYEGPRTDPLFIGDVFPEPRFQSLATSAWLIVQRRRDRKWLDRLVETYPDMKDGVNELLTAHPHGTKDISGDSDFSTLRRDMEEAVGRNDTDNANGISLPESRDGVTWLITECHYQGDRSRICYATDDGIFIGETPEYPYDLGGRIAFTEMVLNDDLLSGIGDSDARIMRGLQWMQDRQTNLRYDLIYNILRPYCWTTNQQLYDDPDSLKRAGGFRLLPPVNGPNEFGLIGEQAALASAAAGIRDTQEIERQIQQLAGETNLSSLTNNDPQQARTATGARLLAYNQDTLTKQLVDAFVQTSLRDDLTMIYDLNRSELSEPEEFDAAPYVRNRPDMQMQPGEQHMVTVSPLDFQEDGEIWPEAGSTLADDDQAKAEQAQYLFQTAAAYPQLFNLEKARDTLLVAMGKGRELHEWAAPPPPPAPPIEPPRLTLSPEWMTLPPEIQMNILAMAGLLPGGPPPAGGAGPEMGPTPAAQPPPPPVASSDLPTDVGPALQAAGGGE